MNKPSGIVMLAGAPGGALVLFLLYAALILGWYEGSVSWWVALAAVGLAFRTLGAMAARRRYLGWEAEWRAMGTMSGDAPRTPKRARQPGSVGLAALAWVASIAFIPPAQGNDALVTVLLLVWIGSTVYLVFRCIRRTARRSAVKRQKEAEDAPVSWTVGRASASPSRESAARNLPGYSARVIDGE